MEPASNTECATRRGEHPLRRQLVREMHLRRFPAIDVPTSLVQTMRVVDTSERKSESGIVQAVPAGFEAELSPNARHLYAVKKSGGALLFWEAHTEASTATMLVHGACDHPFEDQVFDPAYWRWLDGLPGLVLRSIQIAVVASEAEAERLVAEAGFNQSDLVSCRLTAGARLWSDFGLNGDHGRLVISAGDLDAGDLGRVVQRVQELGNYRNLALLGLPMAQAVLPRLQELEITLAQYARDIANIPSSGIADETMLASLSKLTAELAAISAETSSRMSATQAYFSITTDRLATLDVKPIKGYMSLTEFTDRRLIPAVRTCSSFVRRLEQLSERAAWVTSLLRATIETQIEGQNRDLLHSVNANSARQLRLQHFVERLSLVALSYYAMGMVAYLIKGLGKFMPIVETDIALAIALPAVIGGIYLLLHLRMRSINALVEAHK